MRHWAPFLRAALLTFSLLATGSTVHAQSPFDVLAAFGPPGPQSPQASLIQATDGNFYGTTSQGGAAGAGTIVQMTSSGALTVLYSFTGGTDGEYPYSSLIQGADGNFYGTASSGGASSAGTVFQLTPAGNITVAVPQRRTHGNLWRGHLRNGRSPAGGAKSSELRP